MIQPVADKPETLCLAIGIYEEARGEPEDGQIGVAHVILNRVKDKGLSICRTLWQYGQFPWVTMPAKRLRPVEATAWTNIQSLAVRMMDDPGDDNTYGATEFYNPRKCHCRLPGRITTIINRHVFVAPVHAKSIISTAAGLPPWKTMVYQNG